MTQHSSNNGKRRIYFLIGSLGFLLMMIMAVLFFRERIAISDTAYQLVNLLIDHHLAFMPIRIGAASYQMITYVAIMAHCDLKSVMIISSLSSLILFFIFYSLVFAFSSRGFLFFLIPLNLLLFTTDIFYWPVTDTQLGLIWLSMYAAFLYGDRWVARIWAWPLHIVCLMWVQMAHLLIFFPIVLLLLYYYGSLRRLLSVQFLIHITLCLAVFAIRYKLAQQNWYESGKLDIWQNFHNISHLFSFASVQLFAHRLLSAYSIYFASLLLVLIWLFISKQYLKGAAVLAMSLGYWLLVVLCYPGETGIYLENLFVPLGFMVALPLVADIIPAYGSRIAVTVLVVMLIRIGFVYSTHSVFTGRLAAYEPYFKYVRDHKLTGVYVKGSMLPDSHKYFMMWGSGYESMLLSSFDSPDSCMVVCVDDDVSHYSNILQADSVLVIMGKTFSQASIPVNYFNLRKGGFEIISDSTQLYQDGAKR